MLQPSLLDNSAAQWVSVSDAARLEGAAGRSVNKSSISRFIDRNPDVPVRRDAQGRVVAVEYLALARARASSLSVQDSRALGAAPVVPFVGQPPAQAPTSRKRELEERKLELDLAEREGDLLDRTAQTMALEAIAVTLVQGLERRRRKLATDLVDLGDVRKGELALKTADQDLLKSIIGKLQEIAGEMIAGADLGGPVEDAAAA